MSITIAAMWLAAITCLAIGWHLMFRAFPKRTQHTLRALPPLPAPRTALVTPDLLLTPQDHAAVQAAVVLIGAGMERFAIKRIDTLSARGAGQVVIRVTDGATFDGVVLPALQAGVRL